MTLTATDLALFQTINGYAGDYVLDRMAVNIESNHLIKGGIIVILLWYYWFAADNRQDERRQIVVCAVIGALLWSSIGRSRPSSRSACGRCIPMESASTPCRSIIS